MGKDIEADTGRIAEFASSLDGIHKEFANGSNPADDYTVADIGSQLLVDAFDEFSDNWKIHRERLSDELKKLATIAAEAAKSYQEIDTSLANALRGEDAKNRKAGRKAE